MRSFWTRGLSRCTRAGTLDVAIPKLRAGSYFPDWLLERRSGRSER
jgi:putative transposase